MHTGVGSASVRSRDVRGGLQDAPVVVARQEDVMIQLQTVVDVADNTGAKQVMVIRVLGGSTARSGKPRLVHIDVTGRATQGAATLGIDARHDVDRGELHDAGASNGFYSVPFAVCGDEGYCAHELPCCRR